MFKNKQTNKNNESGMHHSYWLFFFWLKALSSLDETVLCSILYTKSKFIQRIEATHCLYLNILKFPFSTVFLVLFTLDKMDLPSSADGEEL